MGLAGLGGWGQRFRAEGSQSEGLGDYGCRKKTGPSEEGGKVGMVGWGQESRIRGQDRPRSSGCMGLSGLGK